LQNPSKDFVSNRQARRLEPPQSGPTVRSRIRSTRAVDDIGLTHPFAPQGVFSEEDIAALHEAALGVLEDLGLRVLLPEARTILAAAGAIVAEDMVHIGRNIVAEHRRRGGCGRQIRRVNVLMRPASCCSTPALAAAM
jgi:trimethylamine:corrinoid methyltransferase-like protein